MVQRESGGQRGPVKTTFRVCCLYSYLVHGQERESGGQRGPVKTMFRVWCLYSYLVHGPERDREEEEREDPVQALNVCGASAWNNVLINQT
jgi:hypothetical protein